MGALAVVGLIAGIAFVASRSRSSSSSRRSSGDTSRWSMRTPIPRLNPHQAALRTGWTRTQQGETQARAVVSTWLGSRGRTAVDAGAYAHELQGLHQDALADFALDTWNTLHAPSSSSSNSSSSSSSSSTAPPSSEPASSDALSPDDAARAVQALSSEDERDHLIATWLARPGRTSVEAGRFSAQLQALSLAEEAEFAIDTWNERPTE